MDIEDPACCGIDPVTVTATGDELTHGPAGGLLHGDPLTSGTLTERDTLLVRQPQGHRHAMTVSE